MTPPSASDSGTSSREHVIEIVDIQSDSRIDLPLIADAAGGICLLPRLIERGQQHRRQYRDDRNHHEQLNEGKLPYMAV